MEEEFLSIKITIFIPFDMILGSEKLFFDTLFCLVNLFKNSDTIEMISFMCYSVQINIM